MTHDRVTQGLLLDFYGELLTEKQRLCCELRFNDDLSLTEIAEQCGISRQGAWDTIRRAEAALVEVEEKTGLIRRFSALHKEIDRLSTAAESLLPLPEKEEAEASLRLLADGLRALKEQTDGI